MLFSLGCLMDARVKPAHDAQCVVRTLTTRFRKTGQFKTGRFA